MRFSRELTISDVDWPSVIETLRRRFHLGIEGASSELASFLRRFQRPLSLSWYLFRRLSAADNRIIASIAKVHGADTVVLCNQHSLAFGWLAVEYTQRFSFRPAFRGSEEGAVSPSVSLTVFRRSLTLDAAWQAFLFQFFLFWAAVLGYVICAGAFYYCIAVVLVLFHAPSAMLILAQKNSTLFLGALGVLIGIAAASGQALRNIYRDCVKKPSKKALSGADFDSNPPLMLDNRGGKKV